MLTCSCNLICSSFEGSVPPPSYAPLSFSHSAVNVAFFFSSMHLCKNYFFFKDRIMRMPWIDKRHNERDNFTKSELS